METIYSLVEKAVSYYNELNKSNFTDSMDVIVIRHLDGSLHSTPFYVRFGKRDVLKPKEKLVSIQVNGVYIDDLKMKLDECGEAFFVDKENSINNTTTLFNISDLDSERPKLEVSPSEPILNTNETNEINNYLKAANTLKDFCDKDKTNDEVDYSNVIKYLVPKFYIESISSLDLNSLSSTPKTSIESVKSNNEDVEMIKLKEKVADIQKKKILKNINLSSDKLKLLNLRAGLNEIKYNINTQSKDDDKKFTKANIFLWESTDRIVISDIDGTITKSDLRGHIMSMIGRDWYHEGVVELFNSIVRNGYKIIYLSARPICQCELTRSLIQNLTQNRESMPIGAVLVNPVDFLIAFQVELIDKNPEEFKINCLNNIKSLFEDFILLEKMEYKSPFYAGFGNKITDVITYKKIGIDEPLIFIINQLGKLTAGSNQIDNFNYRILSENLNNFFPII